MIVKQATIILTFIGLFFSVCAYSQVTVGSSQRPNAGSLLDLKENSNANVNSLKGLGLPRVKLTNLKPTSPATLSASIGGSGNWELEDHTGLLIYNAYEDHCVNPDITQGLYVWDGEEWQPLNSNPEVRIFTDPRDGETYTYRKFGNAGIWMTQNLRAIKYSDGTSIDVHDGTSTNPPTKARYAYPGAAITSWDVKPSSWKKEYGVCYNYLAATSSYAGQGYDQAQLTVSEVPGIHEIESDTSLPITDYRGRHVIQGICPDGWHLPSDREWNELEKEIYQNAARYSTYTAAEVSAWNTATPWNTTWETQASVDRPSSVTAAHGVAMKSTCPVDGIASNGKSLSARKGGFDVHLVGNIYGSSSNSGRRSSALLASSSITGSYKNTQAARHFRDTSVGVAKSSTNKGNLMPVRCKKNDLNL